GDVTTTDRNDIIWLMASMGSLPCLNTRTIRPESGWGNLEVLMIDYLSIVETKKVIHTIETNIVKLLVEIESFDMSSDEFDKETWSSDGLQPNQADLSCVHALNELHLHEIHVVQSKHEADQWFVLHALGRSRLEPSVILSCLLKEQLLEPALNLTVHCCGREFRVLNSYEQKSFDDERGLNCVVQTSFKH
ncbi:hypothetical protein Tco_1160430, partial [Tanacetum coccineum]